MEHFFEAVTLNGDVVDATASEIQAVEALRGTGGVIRDANGVIKRRIDAEAVDHVIDRLMSEADAVEADPVVQTQTVPTEAAQAIERDEEPARTDSITLTAPTLFDSLLMNTQPTAHQATVAAVAGSLLGPLMIKGTAEGPAIEESVRLAEKVVRRVVSGVPDNTPAPPLRDGAGREVIQEVDDRTGQIRNFRKTTVGGRTVIQRRS